MKSQTDERLMKKVARLNEEAFVILYNRYSDRWYKFLKSSMFGNSEIANDLLQELCLKIVTRASSFDHTRSFRVWSFTIARNLVKNEIRRVGNYSKLKDKYQRTAPELIVRPYNTSDESRIIKQQISLLCQEDRELFYLRFGEELKLKEIALIQNQPIGTVKSRLSRLMNKLSRKIVNAGGKSEM